MAWIQTYFAREATGELAAMYERMWARPMPRPYHAPHGDMAGIIRAHSLDPALMAVTFGGVGASLAGEPLTWPQREVLNTATSRQNQCFY